MKLSSLVLLLTLLPGTASFATAADPSANLRLTLPTEFYSVAGQQMSVYFDNVVLTETPEKYRFDVKCDIGMTEDRRWTVRPQQDEVGTHDFSITLRDGNGQQLQSANAKLHVIAADTGAGRPISVLIVGDSLTHATAYPNELARLLSLPGNPTWKMLGTHVPTSATEGVRHEGYGGWTWSRFATHYEPNPDGTHRKRKQPVCILGDDRSRSSMSPGTSRSQPTVSDRTSCSSCWGSTTASVRTPTIPQRSMPTSTPCSSTLTRCWPSFAKPRRMPISLSA